MNVKIVKDGKTIIEIPQDMFPLQVVATLKNAQNQWYEKTYTLILSYWRDENMKKQLDRPKGTQLS